MGKRICEVSGCARPHNARGFCFGHYERWKKLGHPDSTRPLNTHVLSSASFAERIARRVDPGLSSDECWLWRGAIGGRKRRTGIGYGKFTVAGKQYDAHRVSYELHTGETIPKGFQIRHSCDMPLCVNPRHLSIGTNDDNVGDMVSRARQTLGERNPQAILTEDDVRSIRTSQKPVSELAEIYAVRAGTIYGVIARRSWKHVE